ncbi:alpha-galactosidase [Salinibacterium sp. G-O1]|uniref:alpha-galactosidase n=1 Tax=Salinibacterium sp. G-O1 TaxID=3046208 RepID=UPI0024B93FE2|nr:alpha-galactosidase [Salinibacterium sp. G-O1]MDJ0334325.1 alpha-galactosidase [Salinibacterium sp. G-O1]
MNPSITMRGGSVSFILDVSASTPVVVHWGADVGDQGDLLAEVGPIAHSANDLPFRQELLPQSSSGWRGRPALEGHRPDGIAFSPRLVTTDVTVADQGHCEITMADAAAGLSLNIEIALSEHGMLRIRHTLNNDGETDYALLTLATTLPAGLGAAEILDLSGRWCREQHPQRQSVHQGTWLREYRHGRTGHDASVLTAVGSRGFSDRSGKVWATHLGSSGNRATSVEKTPLGSPIIGNAELFAPGELSLAPGGSYTTPWTYASYSANGIDGVSEVFHRFLRSRPNHPSSIRPVVLNTWEAVYFDHNLEGLLQLAERAQLLGVERFVLDDGWFLNRRDDTRGLGDWVVDDAVWPHGLAPLISEVHARGMDFGLWVEPEMVNEDSDVIREHPDWISGPGLSRIPEQWRHQQCIDLVNPQAWTYVFDRLNALLTDNDIAYLKWDQNRDLTEMGHAGSPSTHAQTLAAYRLMDELKRAHPHVEIESCSSGGARVDLSVLERTDRVWASDCNDALERHTIQRWTQSVLPPELVGTHVGPTHSHTTKRTHSLSFRAIVAMFGHFGIEWDVRELDDAAVAELSQAVSLYKAHRALIHSGTSVHADLVDPSSSLNGVVAEDGSEALFAFASLSTSSDETPGMVGFPGLDAASRYEVRVVFPTLSSPYAHAHGPEWVPKGITATGAYLAEVGLPMPSLHPEHAILIRLVAV